jgi:hypothetical protein
VKAIVQDRFGPPEVLRLADTGLPEAGPDDVLVRVHAAALNPADSRGRPIGRLSLDHGLLGISSRCFERLGALAGAAAVEAVVPGLLPVFGCGGLSGQGGPRWARAARSAVHGIADGAVVSVRHAWWRLRSWAGFLGCAHGDFHVSVDRH